MNPNSNPNSDSSNLVLVELAAPFFHYCKLFRLLLSRRAQFPLIANDDDDDDDAIFIGVIDCKRHLYEASAAPVSYLFT